MAEITEDFKPLPNRLMTFTVLDIDDEADAASIVKEYRVYYEDKGKFENELYPGIKELLNILHTSGRKIAERPFFMAVTENES